MKTISTLPILFLVFLIAGCATTESIKEQAAQQILEVTNETSKIDVNVENETLKITDNPLTSEVEQSQDKNYLSSTDDNKKDEKHLVIK